MIATNNPKFFDISIYKEYLSYDKDTGLFTWIKQASHAAKQGSIAGCLMRNGYISIRFKGPMVLAHRLAFFLVHGYCPGIIDHINRNRSDNRINNLREVTPKQNNLNRVLTKGSKTGKLGVSWCSTYNKYVASIYMGNKRKFLGYSSDLDHAIKLRKEAEVKYYGKECPA